MPKVMVILMKFIKLAIVRGLRFLAYFAPAYVFVT